MTYDPSFDLVSDVSGFYGASTQDRLQSPSQNYNFYNADQARTVTYDGFLQCTQHFVPGTTGISSGIETTLGYCRINWLILFPLNRDLYHLGTGIHLPPQLFDLDHSWQDVPTNQIAALSKYETNDTNQSISPSFNVQPEPYEEYRGTTVGAMAQPVPFWSQIPPFDLSSFDCLTTLVADLEPLPSAALPTSSQTQGQETSTVSLESKCRQLLIHRGQFHECQVSGCKKRFRRKDRGLCHVRQHLGYKPFTCDGECGRPEWY
jgi:hypothetical protein